MEEVKWYKSYESVSEVLTAEVVNGVVEYYKKETPTDQTKLYQALGNYYIKTSNPDGVFNYFKRVKFQECTKPRRKDLSPL